MNHKLYYPKAKELLKYTIDWDSLARACHNGVRFQDNIIDYTPYFTRETEELQKRERRIGMGTMGLGTLMIQLRLRYGSEEGNKFIDTLYKFIAYHSYKASMLLAEERGAFPAYEYEKFKQSLYMQNLLSEFPDLDDLLSVTGIRNVTLLTSAPTGSTATYIDNIPMFVEKFGGTSTGVEPYFAFEFYRASRLGEGFMQTMAIAKQYMDEHGLQSTDELPEWFVTAMDLNPLDHVTVQATIQKWVDSAISKTANCPSDYTVEQVDELYLKAYELGCKGITIYRDGSREAQVLSTDKDKAKLEQHLEAEKLEKIKQEESEHQPENTSINNNDQINIVKRPSRLFGFTEKVKFMSGEKLAKAYVTINIDEDGEPIEVFVSTNDAALNEFADSIGRLTTQFLRFAKTQSNVDQLVKHLRANKPMSSLSAKIASLIEQTAYGKIKVPTPKKPKNKKPIFQICPDCGERAYDKANCICTKCGSSHCN